MRAGLIVDDMQRAVLFLIDTIYATEERNPGCDVDLEVWFDQQRSG